MLRHNNEIENLKNLVLDFYFWSLFFFLVRFRFFPWAQSRIFVPNTTKGIPSNVICSWRPFKRMSSHITLCPLRQTPKKSLTIQLRNQSRTFSSRLKVATQKFQMHPFQFGLWFQRHRTKAFVVKKITVTQNPIPPRPKLLLDLHVAYCVPVANSCSRMSFSDSTILLATKNSTSSRTQRDLKTRRQQTNL